MGHSSRSSSTLKKPFQTFKSFLDIRQRTTRTARMKYLLPILILSFAVLMACGAPQDSGRDEPSGIEEGGVTTNTEVENKIKAHMCQAMNQVMEVVFHELATHSGAKQLAGELERVNWRRELGNVARELEKVDWKELENAESYLSSQLPPIEQEMGHAVGQMG